MNSWAMFRILRHERFLLQCEVFSSRWPIFSSSVQSNIYMSAQRDNSTSLPYSAGITWTLQRRWGIFFPITPAFISPFAALQPKSTWNGILVLWRKNCRYFIMQNVCLQQAQKKFLILIWLIRVVISVSK